MAWAGPKTSMKTKKKQKHRSRKKATNHSFWIVLIGPVVETGYRKFSLLLRSPLMHFSHLKLGHFKFMVNTFRCYLAFNQKANRVFVYLHMQDAFLFLTKQNLVPINRLVSRASAFTTRFLTFFVTIPAFLSLCYELFILGSVQGGLHVSNRKWNSKPSLKLL